MTDSADKSEKAQSFADTVQGQRARIQSQLDEGRPLAYNSLTESGKIAAQTLADEEKVRIKPKANGLFVEKRDKGVLLKFLTASFY